MRKELELIEKIEAYLRREMDAADRQAFEQQLAADPELQTEVELQRQLMKGIKTAGLRDEVRRAKRDYYYRRYFIRETIVGLIILAAVALFLQYNRSHKQGREQANTPAITDTTVSPVTGPPTQAFIVDPQHDTIIETRKGIVFSILAHSFLDTTGHPVTGPIQLLVKEALDPATIMMAGLSTRSNGQPLTTGGMFKLDARQGTQSLHIDTNHPIMAEIPATASHGEMQLYKGRLQANGVIDWVDPKPLDHRLTAVDPVSLNFYPPNYLDSLSQWGYDSRDRSFTDSLYYSLDGRPTWGELAAEHPCGLDPAQVHTIWSDSFRNTFIATRAFEQRVQVLHRCKNANYFLDLYVEHLNWDLYRVDSLIATIAKGEEKFVFLNFAARHDGKPAGTPQFQQLAAWYKMKANIYRLAAEKTEREYWDRKGAQDSIANEKQMKHYDRANRNFQEEYHLNLKEACRQLGYTMYKDTVPAPPPPAVYRAPLDSTGWYNIDYAVSVATAERTTLNYTDKQTGRQAVIKYLPVTFQVADTLHFDKVNVYLLPNQLSSFLLVPDTNGIFKEKLNELLQYNMVCLAYKDDEVWYYEQKDVKPGDHRNIRLTHIDKTALTRRLNQVGSLSQGEALQEDNEFFQFDIRDEKRRQADRRSMKLRYMVMRFVFPCWNMPPMQAEATDSSYVK